MHSFQANVTALKKVLVTLLGLFDDSAVIRRIVRHRYLCVAKLQCRRTANSRTALATALKLSFAASKILHQL